VVNAIWPGIFFGVNEFAGALLVIIVLDVLVVATVVSFYRRNRVAGVLLVPYLAWLLHATALNGALLWLN
jgi:tryptophan-rich sensory protein